MRLGIIGNGVVGSALARSYLEHAEVMVYDVVAERCTHSLADALDSNLVFICLPTPQKEGGRECDTSALDRFFGARLHSEPINYVLRSTVPISYTRKLHRAYGLSICHSPEFLTARCSFTDAQIPSRNIIGMPGRTPDDMGCGGNSAAMLLRDLYERRFPGVPCFLMTSDESEAVKLFQNSFFATKVVFFHTMRLLADKLGLDWERVLGGIMTDGRITHAHTKAPGLGGKWGAGGACLEKDLGNLVSCFKEAGLPENFLTAVGHDNKILLKRNRA